jgi:hypothetical protein
MPTRICKYLGLINRTAIFLVHTTLFRTFPLYIITVLIFLRIFFLYSVLPFSAQAHTVSENEL